MTDLPRLCAYNPDPSQYYPCVLNYIGLSSWSLYRCPDKSTFDEISQQCLIKIPVNDAFEKLALSLSTNTGQFHRVASFVLATQVPNENQDLQFQQRQTRLVSFPPTFDKLMKSHSVRKHVHEVRVVSA